ncbi:MAG: PAS domain-containing sensor histidine kinase [Nitrospirae bacterium]|nr:PAS domain-containing sensor histidine kinase [Nitrospirota bacterium]
MVNERHSTFTIGGDIFDALYEYKLLQVLLDNIPDSIYFKDRECRFVKVNKAKAENSGTTIAEMTGKTDSDFMSSEQAARSYVDDNQVMDTGNPIINKVEKITHVNGKEIWASVSKIPWYDAEGTLQGTIGISRNVTDLIRSEDKLKEKSNQLSEMNKELERRVRQEIERRQVQEQLLIQQSKLASMGELISMIAHQWRTPLNTLALLMQDLQSACEFGEASLDYAREAADEAMGQITFMSNTINDFKNFLTPSKRKTIFDAKEAINECLSIISGLLKSAAIYVTGSTNTFGPVRVEGYPNEFKQVIMNLITNSRDSIIEKRKLLNNNTYKGHLGISLERERDHLAINVIDNGVGIGKEIKDRIFEQYFTTKADDAGTGIGLYMSKIIIEKHMGGTIEACNEACKDAGNETRKDAGNETRKDAGNETRNGNDTGNENNCGARVTIRLRLSD